MTTLDRILLALKEKHWMAETNSFGAVFTEQQIEIVREEIVKQFRSELEHVVSVPEPASPHGSSDR